MHSANAIGTGSEGGRQREREAIRQKEGGPDTQTEVGEIVCE